MNYAIVRVAIVGMLLVSCATSLGVGDRSPVNDRVSAIETAATALKQTISDKLPQLDDRAVRLEDADGNVTAAAARFFYELGAIEVLSQNVAAADWPRRGQPDAILLLTKLDVAGDIGVGRIAWDRLRKCAGRVALNGGLDMRGGFDRYQVALVRLLSKATGKNYLEQADHGGVAWRKSLLRIVQQADADLIALEQARGIKYEDRVPLRSPQGLRPAVDRLRSSLRERTDSIDDQAGKLARGSIEDVRSSGAFFRGLRAVNVLAAGLTARKEPLARACIGADLASLDIAGNKAIGQAAYDCLAALPEPWLIHGTDEQVDAVEQCQAGLIRVLSAVTGHAYLKDAGYGPVAWPDFVTRIAGQAWMDLKAMQQGAR